MFVDPSMLVIDHHKRNISILRRYMMMGKRKFHRTAIPQGEAVPRKNGSKSLRLSPTLPRLFHRLSGQAKTGEPQQKLQVIVSSLLVGTPGLWYGCGKYSLRGAVIRTKE